MRVVEPVRVTGAVLHASNIVEDDAPSWAGTQAYQVGDRVIRSHRIYEAVSDHTGENPDTDLARAYWIDIGATNRWRAFDRLISDPVTKAGDVIYTLTPVTLCDCVALFGLDAGAVRIRVTDIDGTLLYDQARAIVDNTGVVDAWSYVFEPVTYDTQEIFADLPIYSGTSVEITVSSAGITRVGQIVIGRNQLLGETLANTEIGFEDFSRKERDAFGNAVLVERPYAQTVSFRFAFPTSDARRINGILARLRATPAVFFAGDDTSQFATTIYGFFSDFHVPLTTNRSFANLDVEGLT